MIGRMVYIGIFIGFLRRLLRKMLAPARKLRKASGYADIQGKDDAEFALFLVEGIYFYVVPGTAHVMDSETADWLCSEVQAEWNQMCGTIMKGLSVHVLHTGSADQQLYELAGRLKSEQKSRLRALVNGARATYNDKWRWRQ